MIVAPAAVLIACTVGPSNRPPLATSGAPGTGVATTSTSAMPIGPGGPGRTSDPISWSECPAQIKNIDPATGDRFAVQCGQVVVPKSYTNNGSGVLSISVTRARAATTPANAPPLLVLSGAPGENGTQHVASVAGVLPAEVLARFSVIVMDLRGTGDSVPIDCVSGKSSSALLSLGADPTTTTAAALLAGLSRTLTFDCGDMVGPDLSDYSTVPAADDIDTVRAALGVRTINVVGQGFGATLGAVYADRYPGRIGAAVLDGPSDPSLPVERQAALTAAAQQKALLSFAAACQTFAGGCPLGGDPAGAVKSLISRLGDRGAASTDGYITGGSILLALAGELGSPAGWPGLAAALAAANRGDLDPVAAALQASLGADNVEQQQAGRLVYQCNDSTQRLSGSRLNAAVAAVRPAAPLFGPFLLGLVGVCSSWPAPESALGPLTATGAPPILVVGAVDDPTSPYAGVRSLTAQLDSATLLSWQSGTHGGYPTSRCVTTAVNSYLLNGTVPANGTLCPP